ncbi:MAG: hypothetical protein HZA83_01580 [Thaumarchaeota archaeon]|nr:hypothetical protein [Nitrososphaerota archaeon]
MKPFCEIIVSVVLPAMRALIAKELTQTYNLNQPEISRKLGITQPAVSQYRSEVRGQRVRLLQSNRKIMSLIQSLSHDIASDKVEAAQIHEKICKICRKIREEKIICQLHETAYPFIAPCETCFRC